MKNQYTIQFKGNGKSADGDLSEVFASKRDAVAFARQSARQMSGHVDFRGGHYEVWKTPAPSAAEPEPDSELVFTSRIVS